MEEFKYKELTYAIIGAAMEVHTQLGPGFPEEAYQKSLEIELRERGFSVSPQHRIVVEFKGQQVAEYFLDILVEGKVVAELKAVERLAPVHHAQVVSYLRASGLEVGLLLNFGEVSLRHKRIVVSERYKKSDKSV